LAQYRVCWRRGQATIDAERRAFIGIGRGLWLDQGCVFLYATRKQCRVRDEAGHGRKSVTELLFGA